MSEAETQGLFQECARPRTAVHSFNGAALIQPLSDGYGLAPSLAAGRMTGFRPSLTRSRTKAVGTAATIASTADCGIPKRMRSSQGPVGRGGLALPLAWGAPLQDLPRCFRCPTP
jgi:hypothetical protein